MLKILPTNTIISIIIEVLDHLSKKTDTTIDDQIVEALREASHNYLASKGKK
ncbi:MAG TPA: hypothetical protein PKZ69_01340 [Candidatus Cloacimonadota bacterium]|nr:hypothetical protein [Candidatus Cloacimonadota bacterium]